MDEKRCIRKNIVIIALQRSGALQNILIVKINEVYIRSGAVAYLGLLQTAPTGCPGTRLGTIFTPTLSTMPHT